MKKNLETADVQKIARLAQINLSNEEVLQLSEQLSKVIAHFEEIASVNTADVEPLITPTEMKLVLRADQVQQNYTAESMIQNAPEKQGLLFKVPPVV